MDWELYERYRATLLLVVVFITSFLLMAFQRTSAVGHVRTLLVAFSSPAERFLSGIKSPGDASAAPPSGGPESSATAGEMLPHWAQEGEAQRAMHVLSSENIRLRDLLELHQRRWPRAVAARVVGRDPQRWFQEVVLDKGREDGLALDDAVIAIVNGREGLVGRVTEASSHVAKVMLVQDSLSAVAATVLGSTAEDGVVEGSNGHELVLKYLDRSSKVKIGDAVVTSGLGRSFPDGVPLGWVEDLGLDQRQLFLQARLRPAIPANQLHMVLILTRPVDGAPAR